MKEGSPRIAVLRALKLGDFLTAVPALRSLRAGFPSAEITLIGLPWARQLAARFHSYIDRFVEYPGFPGLELTDHPVDQERFFDEQSTYCYDIAIQMHGAGPQSNLFVKLLRAKRTAGLTRDRSGDGLTDWQAYPDELPEVLRALRVVELLGCPLRGKELEFPLEKGDREEATLLLGARANERPLIGIHAGASGGMDRRWPVSSFAQVADRLNALTGARIVLTGSRSEARINEELSQRTAAPVVDLSGRTSLGGLGAVLERLDVFVSNDTGPAHLADALAVPSVTIFGSADPVRWSSLDLKIHPWLGQPVEPDRVIELATRLLAIEAVA